VVAVLAGMAAATGISCGEDEGGAQTPPEPVVLWAAGDGGDGSDLARGVANLIRNDEPDRVLYLGDVYNTGTAKEFKRNFAGVYGDLVNIMHPTPGNHEWGQRRKGYFPYWRRVKGRTQPPWYRFKSGGWEIFSLNSEAAHGAGSRQLRWLEDRLADAKGDCRLAFWHRPRFSAGTSYGDDDSFGPFWRAFKGKARIVLAGHEHNMQRLKARGGIVPIVSGAAGTELYPVRESDPRLRFSSDNRRGAVRLELEPGSAELEFFGASGKSMDRSKVSCSPG
jgi:hypothetical protein